MLVVKIKSTFLVDKKYIFFYFLEVFLAEHVLEVEIKRLFK